MSIKLTKKQIEIQKESIYDYINSSNAATGSKFDANANVELKNVSTLSSELNKYPNIQIGRALLTDFIIKEFDKKTGLEYNKKLNNHLLYCHDESQPTKPYCTSITMYPFLEDGLTKLGGESKAPKHLNSFCGSFVNLVFAIASQFAGAVATVEYLMYFDYFARKDYGDNYLDTHKELINNHLQHCVYAINQPAAARDYQSIFWNISIFDSEYFNSMFGDFVFPDMSKPKWETLNKLQIHFMKWFNKERENAILTFPVVTAAILTKDKKPKDEKFAKFLSKELSESNSFFIYMSDQADSLASCCRMRNEVTDNTFSYSLGAGGVMTGSINVMTLNINRLVQEATKKNKDIYKELKKEIQEIHKYQYAYKKMIEVFYENHLLTVYDAGFISLDKQFLTIGLNGLLESAEFLGLKANNNKDYKEYLKKILKVIYEENIIGKKKYNCLFNTEIVPGENLGKKNASWDKKDNLIVPRDIYNSYFYKVEDEETDIVDKFVLHGKEINQYLDGGSALHLNLEEYLTEDQFYNLLCLSAQTGCNYFTTNVKITICNDCNYINKNTKQYCTKCGLKNIDYGTRIIGYLKRISVWSEARQIEENLRFYNKSN